MGGGVPLHKVTCIQVCAVTSNSLALFGKCRFTKVRVWNKKITATNDLGVKSVISFATEVLEPF